MITIELMGGLGNQLFQLFTLISYSLNNKIQFYIEDKQIENGHRKTTYWNNLLNLLKPYINKSDIDIDIYIHIIKETQFHYIDLPVLNINTYYKLNGYYQSYKYFDSNKEYLFNLIGLENIKKTILQKCTDNNYNSDYENTVALHFRIGDYSNLQQYHPLMTVEYYIKSINQLILDTNKNDWNILYFCEDIDINYVNDKINIIKNNECFDNLTFTKINSSLEDWEQIIIMSLCKHNIIANSTFSWWGAYLNTNNNNNNNNNNLQKVYYPEVWFGSGLEYNNMIDLFPCNWTKIII